MSLKLLQMKLMVVARKMPVSDEVPYLFEKRVLARLRASGAAVDRWALWARGLWRAATICVCLAAVIGVLSIALERETQSMTLETALLPEAEQLSDTW